MAPFLEAHGFDLKLGLFIEDDRREGRLFLLGQRTTFGLSRVVLVMFS